LIHRRNSLLPPTNFRVSYLCIMKGLIVLSTQGCVKTEVVLPKNRKHHSLFILYESVVSLVLVRCKYIMQQIVLVHHRPSLCSIFLMLLVPYALTDGLHSDALTEFAKNTKTNDLVFLLFLPVKII
jgi:hypothetical protein